MLDCKLHDSSAVCSRTGSGPACPTSQLCVLQGLDLAGPPPLQHLWQTQLAWCEAPGHALEALGLWSAAGGASLHPAEPPTLLRLLTSCVLLRPGSLVGTDRGGWCSLFPKRPPSNGGVSFLALVQPPCPPFPSWPSSPRPLPEGVLGGGTLAFLPAPTSSLSLLALLSACLPRMQGN